MTEVNTNMYNSGANSSGSNPLQTLATIGELKSQMMRNKIYGGLTGTNQSMDLCGANTPYPVTATGVD